MKVTIADREYHVSFEHKMLESKNKNKRRFVTLCFIKHNGEIIYNATSKLNPIDKLNRNKGKAQALTNLFKKYKQTKEFRLSFWTEFHKNFKI